MENEEKIYMENEEKISSNIITELQMQIALGTLDYPKAGKILAFLAKNSTDPVELSHIFWLLVDNGYNTKWSSSYTNFIRNNHVDELLKKYVLPLANNRPIPDIIIERYPRWASQNSNPK